METNPIQPFEQISYVWYRITQNTFQSNFCQNTCNEIEKDLLSLSYYKSMETLSCHNDENSTQAMVNGNKNIIFGEANVMNIS